MLSSEEINELLRLDDDALVDVREAAAVVGLKPASLNWYRSNAPSSGPRHVRVASRAVRYRMGDLRAYIASRRADR